VHPQRLMPKAKQPLSQRGIKMASKKTDPCWDGYTQVGMKMKNGKKVPNCVPDRSGRIPNSKPRKKVSK